MTGPEEIARAAWGDDLPDWVAGLAMECAGSSQNSVAKKMDRSAALISGVLRCKYGGDLAGVETTYRGVFEAQTVECPALGVLPSNECQSWRKKSRAFSPVNTLRVRMFRACTTCRINRRDR